MTLLDFALNLADAWESPEQQHQLPTNSDPIAPSIHGEKRTKNRGRHKQEIEALRGEALALQHELELAKQHQQANGDASRQLFVWEAVAQRELHARLEAERTKAWLLDALERHMYTSEQLVQVIAELGKY